MDLDLVIPAHNEEHRIGPTLHAYRTRLPAPGTRFLVALDRCVDRTAEVVRRQANEDPRVCIVEYPRLGKGGVLMEAFRRCDADLVGFVDADGATPPREFLRLVEAVRQADGAIACRRHPAAVVPRRQLGRRVASAGFVAGVRTLFRLPFTDPQCGAKVLRREVIEAVLPLLSSRDFLFDVDLLYLTAALGYRVVEVPTIWIDRDGSRVSAFADSKRMAVSALRLWLHHRVMPLEPPSKDPAPRRDRDAVAS